MLAYQFPEADRKMLQALNYRVNERKFKDIQEFLRLGRIRETLSVEEFQGVYTGAEHRGTPKLPNLTYLPNLRITPNMELLGTTFGHQHNQLWKGDPRDFQEIYEFQGYGAMLLRSADSATLHLLRPNEKVIVKTSDNMAFFNLQEQPLTTLDYANPQMNEADKILETRIGPLLLITKQTQANEYLFRVNENYYLQGIVKKRPKAQAISIKSPEAGESLLKKIYENKNSFERIGIKISEGFDFPTNLRPLQKPSLLELALTQNPLLFSKLMIGKDNNSFKGNLIYDESGYPIAMSI